MNRREFQMRAAFWWTTALLSLVLVACARGSGWNGRGMLQMVEGFALARGTLRLLAVVGGAVLLVAGWRVYRLVVASPGFLIGGLAGAHLAFRLGGNTLWALVALVAGGILGAWLALAVHDLALFVIGAIGGGFIAANLWGMITGEACPLLVLIIAGVLGGVALLAMARLWMILLSSAIGATMFGWGMQARLGLILLLFLVGLALQYGLSRAAGEKPEAYPQEFT